MPTAIWWIRRDLRLNDNPALNAAVKHGRLVPVFINDPAITRGRMHGSATRRRDFLMASLSSLDADLQARGARLIVRTGPPERVLRDLASETGADLIVAGEDFTPYARSRDARVQRELPLRLVEGATVHHPLAVKKADGGAYTVFTPFSKAWLALPVGGLLGPGPNRLTGPDATLSSEVVPYTAAPTGFPASEAEARRRLIEFAVGGDPAIGRYKAERDLPGREGTSKLSPYLRFGLISAREAAAVARESIKSARDPAAAQGAQTWLNELIWREFYQSVLYHYPDVLECAFNPTLREIAWRDAPDDLAAWKAGQTGVPIVDAAMRQLAETGWMHNRARMIVASFLVKDLLIDWRLGEQWFMDQLIDGDPAANNGGWQWTAGVGTDAAPYFRIFNPVLQSRKFDPSGAYIRRYVPELVGLSNEAIHEPWTLTPLEQRAGGVSVGSSYPAPIVDRPQARERVLRAYQASRDRHQAAPNKTSQERT